ncbi:hypothetical protein F7725_000584, partial [Dissostichus mawsoni]
MVAPLVNKLGRKGTLLFNNIFSIVPAVMMESARLPRAMRSSLWRGLSSNVVPMYLGELAPKNLRGALGIIPQLFITIGILSAQVLGIRRILGNSTESPRYMLIQRGDEKTAQRALQRLRGREDVDAELSEMRLEDQSEKAEGRLSVLSLLSQRSLRWQLISIVVMNMGQQLSGVNADVIQYVTVGTGAVNVFMTIAAVGNLSHQVFIVEAAGRRVLLLCGFGICCGACVLLTVALNLQESVTWMSYGSIACVIIYVIGHAIGPSSIPNVVTTEMFRQSARPAAFMVAGSVHWLSNFTVGLVFPFLERGLGSYSFIIFAFICLVTLIYIWFVVPETKNKTFLENCQMFAKRNKVEIKLGDGDLPLTEGKESLEDAARVDKLVANPEAYFSRIPVLNDGDGQLVVVAVAGVGDDGVDSLELRPHVHADCEGVELHGMAEASQSITARVFLLK